MPFVMFRPRGIPPLLALLVLIGSLLPGDARAYQQAAPITLRVVPHVTTSFANDSLYVHLTAQFWAHDRQYSVEELAGLGSSLSFDNQATRGHTVFLALPPGTLPFVEEVDGPVTVVDLSESGASAAAVEQVPALAELVGSPVWLRDQYVARLRLRPLRWDVATGELLLVPALDLRLRLIGEWPKPAPSRPDPYWESIYRSTVLNYEFGRIWRQPPSPPQQTLPAPRGNGEGWRLRLGVTESGLHVLNYADIAALGLDLSGIDPRRWQLYHQAEATAMIVEGETDGSFDPGDRLIFYAPPWFSRHTVEDVFWLVLAEEGGERVPRLQQSSGQQVLPAYVDTVRREEQLLYISDLPLSGGGDHWYWTSIRPVRTNSAVKTINFDLYPVTWGPVNATLRLRVLGKESGTVQVRLHINGFEAGSFTITDKQSLIYETSFPHFLLQEGNNQGQIEVEKVGDSTNTVVLDWIELEYVRQFTATAGRLRFRVDWPGVWRVVLHGFADVPYVWDVSDPHHPRQVDGMERGEQQPASQWVEFVSASEDKPTYEAASEEGLRRLHSLAWAPSLVDLRDEQLQADYLIITPRDFLPAAERLAGFRAGQGLQTLVVSLDDIYDVFAAGVAGPQPIHDFLAYALAKWQAPVPAFVLLLGDAHYDPKAYIANTPVLLPAYLNVADPWLGEVADESFYASVAGDDRAPDLMLGRLPLRTLAEAEGMVDKLIAYEEGDERAGWLERMALVTDDPDSAGDFHALADQMADLVSPLLAVRKYYFGGNYASVADLRSALLADWSQGAFIVNYVGHGHPSAWGGEQILRVSDLSGLQNQGRPALLLAMASLSGIYYWPGEPSLLEAMLLLPEGRGVIGYVASTGYGIASGNALVDEGMLGAIINDGVVHLGEAMTRGKLHLYGQGYSYTEFLTQLYALMGDPATRLPAHPWPQTYYLPLVQR